MTKPILAAHVEPQLFLASNESALVVRMLSLECRCGTENRWWSDAREPRCAECGAGLSEAKP